METLADYILNEEDLQGKMDIIYRLQRMLKERKNISIYFNKIVIFKTEIARMFLEYTDVENENIDKNLVLTASLLCNCKRPIKDKNIENLYNYAKNGADFLATLGFSKRFCRICEEVNRNSGINPREPEGDILEIVDKFGDLLLETPEKEAYTPEKAISELENKIFRVEENRYLGKFKDFVKLIQEVEV